LDLDEKKFRYLVNDNAMATEKTAEGIRKFAAECGEAGEASSRRSCGSRELAARE